MNKIYGLLVLIGSVCYGIQSSLVKILYSYGITMWQVLLLEYMLGSAIFLTYVFIRERKELFSLSFSSIFKLFILAILGPGLTSVFYYLALSYLPASLGVVFLFQYLIFIVIFNKLLNKAPISLFQVMAMILIFLGTLLAVDLFSIDLQGFEWKGAFFGVLAALSYAIFLFFTEETSHISTPAVRSAIIATSIMIAAFIVKNPLEVFSQIEVSLSTFILLGLLITLIGQVIPLIAFNIGVPKIGSQLAGIISSFELPAAILFASVLLKEKMELTQWIGIILITIAIVVSELKSDK